MSVLLFALLSVSWSAPIPSTDLAADSRHVAPFGDDKPLKALSA